MRPPDPCRITEAAIAEARRLYPAAHEDAIRAMAELLLRRAAAALMDQRRSADR